MVRLTDMHPLALFVLSFTVGGTLFTPAIDDAETYSETWSFILDATDGTYVQLQLGITNAGFGSQKGLCRALVVPHQQPPWTESVSVSRGEWKTLPNGLRVGPCEIAENAQETLVTATLKAARVQLHIGRQAQSTQVPGTPLTPNGLGGVFYRSDILIPHASATGIWTHANSSQAMHGFAYADHSRGTVLPKEIATGWLRWRSLGETCPVLLQARYFGGKTFAWHWSADLLSPAPIELTPLNTPPVSAQVTRFSIDTSVGKLWITPERALYRYAPAEEFGLIGKAISSWIGNAETFTYRAKIEGLACGPTAGILELTRVY